MPYWTLRVRLSYPLRRRGAWERVEGKASGGCDLTAHPTVSVPDLAYGTDPLGDFVIVLDVKQD